jgi:hypothetical protein
MKCIFLSSAFLFTVSAHASLETKTWSLNKGNKHPSFLAGKNIKAMEADVFSEVVSFQDRWNLVSEVAEMKSPKQAEAFLMKCLDSNKWFLQSAALKQMKNRNPELSIYYAERLLKTSKALVVRSEAVEILSSLGGPDHTKALWSALKQQKNFMGSKSLWIRPQIVKTIFKLERSNHSKKEWNLLLRDSDSQIKAMAKKVTESL